MEMEMKKVGKDIFWGALFVCAETARQLVTAEEIVTTRREVRIASVSPRGIEIEDKTGKKEIIPVSRISDDHVKAIRDSLTHGTIISLALHGYHTKHKGVPYILSAEIVGVY